MTYTFNNLFGDDIQNFTPPHLWLFLTVDICISLNCYKCIWTKVGCSVTKTAFYSVKMLKSCFKFSSDKTFLIFMLMLTSRMYILKTNKQNDNLVTQHKTSTFFFHRFNIN